MLWVCALLRSRAGWGYPCPTGTFTLPEMPSLAFQPHPQIHPGQAPAAGLGSLHVYLPSFRHPCRNECACNGAQSARWKSASEYAIDSEAEGNCVAARRGGEQPEANWQSVGEDEPDSAAWCGEPPHSWRNLETTDPVEHGEANEDRASRCGWGRNAGKAVRRKRGYLPISANLGDFRKSYYPLIAWERGHPARNPGRRDAPAPRRFG